jgi:uncharacterized membrane protein
MMRDISIVLPTPGLPVTRTFNPAPAKTYNRTGVRDDRAFVCLCLQWQHRGKFMAPFILLIVLAVAFWLSGRVGVAAFQAPSFILRAALGIMFFLTASAHWGKRRPDLIRMVPPALPRPDLLVTMTGLLEILGAIGLFVPRTARVACVCLALLLVALFPANVRAAREHLTIAGRRVPSLLVRSLMQLVFVATLIAAAWLK